MVQSQINGDKEEHSTQPRKHSPQRHKSPSSLEAEKPEKAVGQAQSVDSRVMMPQCDCDSGETDKSRTSKPRQLRKDKLKFQPIEDIIGALAVMSVSRWATAWKAGKQATRSVGILSLHEVQRSRRVWTLEWRQFSFGRMMLG